MGKSLSWLLGLGIILGAGPNTGVAQEAQALAARIDQYFAARWAAEKVEPAPRADDAEFMRRLYFDLSGRIPSVAEAGAFLNDPAPDKRSRLVEKLLASPEYVTHFANFWRALMIPETNTAMDLRARAAGFDAWLRNQLADNVPYDRMVRDLITMPVGPVRVARGTRPATTPNEPTPLAFYLAKDVKSENLGASTARLFLGIRLECAQCHHHPFARWKREQFWSFAAFFNTLRQQKQEGGGGVLLENPQESLDKKIPGSTSENFPPPLFLDGTEPRFKYRTSPRVTLAEWMTAPDNPYFARAVVNRFWGYFLGIGLGEPVDDLEGEHPPTHPELLDELAREFTAHQYDVKMLIRAITASRVYQLTSKTMHPSQDDPQRFARMAVKGLTAEQIFDSLVQATGYQEPTRPAPMPNQPPENVGPARAAFLARFANQGDKRTEPQTSIPQALALMNGKFVHGVTSLKGEGTLATVAKDPSLNTAQRIETLFLATVSRKPTAKESARLVAFVDGGGADHDSQIALADVFWALLNSGEFIMNH